MKRKFINNNFLFVFCVLVLTSIFYFLMDGIGVWPGFLNIMFDLFDTIYNNTYYGRKIVVELFYLIFLIPFIYCYRNAVFKQSKKKNFISLFFAWPVLAYIAITFFSNLINSNFNTLNINELVAIIFLSITVSFVEEFMYRGLIQNLFLDKFKKNKFGIYFSIIFCGFIFGLSHSINLLSCTDFLGIVYQVIFTSILGTCFGFIYFKTNNIFNPIILHFLWNFSVFFPDIDLLSSCSVANNSNIVYTFSLQSFLISIITIFINLLPLLLFCFYVVYIENKKLEVKKENVREKNNLLNFNIIFSIVIIFSLVCYFLVLSFNNLENLSCPKYIEIKVSNYSETISNYFDYDLTVEQSNSDDLIVNDDIKVIGTNYYYYNFKINDHNKFILTLNNDKKYIFNYENVFSFSVYDCDEFYCVILLCKDVSGDTIVYYSDYLSKYNISYDSDFISNFIDSFHQIMVPTSIVSSGYFEYDEKKYPLFVSLSGEKYFLTFNGDIYKYD